MHGQEPPPPPDTLFPDTDSDKIFGPVFAIHNGEHLFLEGGFGIGVITSRGHGFPMAAGTTLSVEVKPGENIIVAPRLTLWYTIFGAVGLGVGYYTDFDGGTFMIQPELGIGFLGTRVTWRINFPVGKEIDGLNVSDFSMNIFLPVF